MSDLPIHKLRQTFFATRGSIVITAPTGSGKSTQIPRWAAERGEVIVVEPRRVACRALASRVAELEGTRLGGRVGFQVRGESRLSDETRIRFITPGIALQQMDRLRDASAVILDELHERRLDVDLLLALLMDAPSQLIAMSATLDGPRVAAHVQGTLLVAEGRLFPVDVQYRDRGEALPSPRDLDQRIAEAVNGLQSDGDVLVFLPGKSEIAAAASALRGTDCTIVELHGGMSLDAQSRVFAPTRNRKIVLATNVAETSLTVPGIAVVIDSGLVRRTTYHHGRAHLALRPIAVDAADQRAGRAGRTGPGVCIRLWSRRGSLDAMTPPEVHRESLVPLILAAAACGQPDVDRLPLLDAPKPHALEDARKELRALGALDADDQLTENGRELFGLPIDAALGRLLVEARSRGPEVLQDTVDLVACLGSGRRLFPREPEHDDPFRRDGCDAAAMVRAVRSSSGPVDAAARREARTIAKRLRQALQIGPADSERKVDPDVLRTVALGADPRAAHIVRRRGKGGTRFAFANGGTELALARESAAWKHLETSGSKSPAEALVIFDVRAFGSGRERRLLATCASPCSLHALREQGLGRPRLAKTWLDGKGMRRRVLAEIEQVYAGRVLDTHEEIPKGDVARDAIVQLLLRGSLFRASIKASRERIDSRALAAQLSRLSSGREHGVPEGLDAPPAFEDWVRERVEELGIESGDELGLLSADDFLADELPYELQSIIADLYPREVSLGDVTYRVEFDLEKRQAVLSTVRGGRSKPPNRSFLPKFPGLKIFAEAGRGLHAVR